MAKARLVLGVLLLIVLEMEIITGPFMTPVQAIDCPSNCARRCSKASRSNLCNRACNTCCQRCGCVPPGTSGNKDVCPCYANMKTKGGRLKCP